MITYKYMWYMDVCLYIYIYVCMYVFMYACVFVFLCLPYDYQCHKSELGTKATIALERKERKREG